MVESIVVFSLCGNRAHGDLGHLGSTKRGKEQSKFKQYSWKIDKKKFSTLQVRADCA
jgi:hypothetical protein